MRHPPDQTGVWVAGRHLSANWTLLFTKLVVEIDGVAHVGRWRPHVIAVSPGAHDVAVYFRYVGQPRCGEASARVTVVEGRATKLQYRAPHLITGPGTLVEMG